jgi:phage repressor protein C with HTH and peptisase S24 domain
MLMLMPELDFDDEWSDDDMPQQAQVPAQAQAQGGSSSDSNAKTKALESELERARADVKRLQTLVQEMTDDAENDSPDEKDRIVLDPGVKSGAGAKGKGKAVRDDDTHYFDSYEHNGQSLTSSRRGDADSM